MNDSSWYVLSFITAFIAFLVSLTIDSHAAPFHGLKRGIKLSYNILRW